MEGDTMGLIHYIHVQFLNFIFIFCQGLLCCYFYRPELILFHFVLLFAYGEKKNSIKLCTCLLGKDFLLTTAMLIRNKR